MITYFFTAWVIDEVIVAGVQWLARVDRVQYDFITDNNLSSKSNWPIKFKSQPHQPIKSQQQILSTNEKSTQQSKTYIVSGSA
jgi:hypothetical protein